MKQISEFGFVVDLVYSWTIIVINQGSISYSI